MKQEITIKDIKNALKELNKDKKLVRMYDAQGNWVDIDQRTFQVETIGCGKKAIKAIKNFYKHSGFNSKKKKFKINKFCGIPIVEAKK